MSKLSKALKKPGNLVKKVANVGIAAGAGLLTGGPLGAVAAGGREAVVESKTGKSKPIQWRSAYQGAVTGAVAGVAQAAVAHAGGTTGIARGLGQGVQKLGAFAKTGGLAGNFGKISKGVSGFAGKALPAVSALLHRRPQASPTADGDIVSDLVTAGKNFIGPEVTAAAHQARDTVRAYIGQNVDDERERASRRVRSLTDRTSGQLNDLGGAEVSPGAPSKDDNGLIPLALAACAAIFFKVI